MERVNPYYFLSIWCIGAITMTIKGAYPSVSDIGRLFFANEAHRTKEEDQNNLVRQVSDGVKAPSYLDVENTFSSVLTKVRKELFDPDHNILTSGKNQVDTLIKSARSIEKVAQDYLNQISSLQTRDFTDTAVVQQISNQSLALMRDALLQLNANGEYVWGGNLNTSPPVGEDLTDPNYYLGSTDNIELIINPSDTSNKVAMTETANHQAIRAAIDMIKEGANSNWGDAEANGKMALESLKSLVYNLGLRYERIDTLQDIQKDLYASLKERYENVVGMSVEDIIENTGNIFALEDSKLFSSMLQQQLRESRRSLFNL